MSMDEFSIEQKIEDLENQLRELRKSLKKSNPLVSDYIFPQKAMIEGLNENRFFVHIAARRTGKSYAAAILAFGKLLEPGQQVMVVAPNFSLSSIIILKF